MLDAVPQQQENVRSRPRANSQPSPEQSFSSQSSFEEGLGSQLNSNTVAGGDSRSKPGDFQTIFGEFKPGQTFATLQSLGGGGGNINPQSNRIPPTINQQRFEQNQIFEQPQRNREPQTFEQNQRFEPAQVFEQPRTTAQPQRFVQPQRFEQPRRSEAQNFSPQQPPRPQQPGFSPQLQTSEGVKRFEQRQQNKLNLGSGSNLAANSNLRQNGSRPPSPPQQSGRQSSFQQVALRI